MMSGSSWVWMVTEKWWMLLCICTFVCVSDRGYPLLRRGTRMMRGSYLNHTMKRTTLSPRRQRGLVSAVDGALYHVFGDNASPNITNRLFVLPDGSRDRSKGVVGFRHASCLLLLASHFPLLAHFVFIASGLGASSSKPSIAAVPGGETHLSCFSLVLCSSHCSA